MVESQADATRHAGQPGFGGSRGFWGGALEAVVIVAGFAILGLAWAAVGASDPAEAADGGRNERPRLVGDYALAAMPPESPSISEPALISEPPSIWLVDGYNVLHTGLLGGRDRGQWWTEPRRRELLERVGRFHDPLAEIWVVFDGAAEVPAVADSRPICVFAPSADAWLVERVRSAEDPSQLTVVTADRQVAGRVSHRGASVLAPRDFLSRCATEAADASGA